MIKPKNKALLFLLHFARFVLCFPLCAFRFCILRFLPLLMNVVLSFVSIYLMFNLFAYVCIFFLRRYCLFFDVHSHQLCLLFWLRNGQNCESGGGLWQYRGYLPMLRLFVVIYISQFMQYISQSCRYTDIGYYVELSYKGLLEGLIVRQTELDSKHDGQQWGNQITVYT